MTEKSCAKGQPINPSGCKIAPQTSSSKLGCPDCYHDREELCKRAAFELSLLSFSARKILEARSLLSLSTRTTLVIDESEQ